MKKNKVLASKFIEWYYNNHEDVEMLGTSMMHLLKRTGQCSLSFQEVFDGCNYVPKYICEDISEDMYTTDYDTDEVELINDFNNKQTKMENNNNNDAVEITPAQSELETIKAELEQFKQSLQIQRVVQNDLRCAMADSVYHLLEHLDADVIADTICRLNTTKEIQIIKHMANKNHNIVKIGLNESDNAEQFSTDFSNLDDIISDKYDEGDIISLIDDRYSWNDLLDRAFSRGSIDNSDVVHHIDIDDIVNDHLRGGNMEFSDVMDYFDESDCFSYLSEDGRLTWDNVKDYVDMDDVKADIELDNDIIGEYISNLNNDDFRNLITNLS